MNAHLSVRPSIHDLIITPFLNPEIPYLKFRERFWTTEPYLGNHLLVD